MAGIRAATAAGIKTVALSTSIPADTLASAPGVSLVVPDFTGLSFPRLSAVI
jgi:beta-phosphoglucomutase-like phosphatase (HAD superfamily)